MIAPLVGKQRTSVDLAQARLNLWEGSVRSSKTICSLLAWLEYVLTGPDGNLAMIGKTERTLKRNVIDVLVDMLGEHRCRYVQGAGEIWLLGRRVYVAGANDQRSEDKIRGLTLAGAYVDEISVVPEGFWSMLLTRLSVEDAKLFGTTNPDSPNHWLMRDYLKRSSTWIRHDGTVQTFDDDDEVERLDLARFSFRLADNPNLSAAYLAALAREFTGLWRLRFIEGLWVLAEGAIYDTFDPTPGQGTVLDVIPRISQWVVAVDYGTTNPFVALLIGVGRDPDGREALYVAREWRWDSKIQQGQLTDAQYSTKLRAWLTGLEDTLPGASTPWRVIVDPSAASFIVQLYQDGWAGVREGDGEAGRINAVRDGIRSTASLMAATRLQIHSSCTGTIDELSGYVWDPKAALRGEEKPLKTDDHGPDALRYGVMGTRRWWRDWLTGSVDTEAA